VNRFVLIILSVLITLGCCGAILYYRDVLSDAPYYGNVADEPTVFAFTIDGREMELKPVILSALDEVDLSRKSFKFFENIIVIEEEDSWIVSLVPRGNGLLKRKYFYSHHLIIEGGVINIRLRKNDLTVIDCKEGKLERIVPRRKLIIELNRFASGGSAEM